MTPRRFAPEEFGGLGAHGIGLTDLAKEVSGADATLGRDADDPGALRAKIERFRPRALAFNGKRPARIFMAATFDLDATVFGRQPRDLGATAIFVLPSTSGAARRYWDISHWQALAEFITAG